MTKIKVGFNVGPLKNGHQFRGIGQHTKNLLDELRLREDLEIKEVGSIGKLSQIDIVHHTFFDLFRSTLPITKTPAIVTIHDVIPLVFPNHYPVGMRGRIAFIQQKRSLKYVKAVITISESAKEDIVRYLDVDPKKVFPIHLGVGNNFVAIKNKEILNEVKKRYELPDQFALYIGNVNWNKNLINIVEGCLKANIPLVLIGKSFEDHDDLNHPELRSYKKFLQLYDKHPLVIKMGFLENDLVIKIMNLATVLLLPSYYEGFGLPIIESQACGLPVITSQISSMPEVAGDGAVLVDPYNSVVIADAISKIRDDNRFREMLIIKGFQNSKKFSWKITAEETAKVYKNVGS